MITVVDYFFPWFLPAFVFELFLYCSSLVCGKPRTCTTDSDAKCAPYDWLMNGRGIDLNSALPWVFLYAKNIRNSRCRSVSWIYHGLYLLKENEWKKRASCNCIVHLRNTLPTTSKPQVLSYQMQAGDLSRIHDPQAVGNYNVATCKVGKLFVNSLFLRKYTSLNLNHFNFLYPSQWQACLVHQFVRRLMLMLSSQTWTAWHPKQLAATASRTVKKQLRCFSLFFWKAGNLAVRKWVKRIQ